MVSPDIKNREPMEPVPIKKLIVDGVLSETVGIPLGVRTLDLDTLQKTGDELMQESESDPEHKEAGSLYIVVSSRPEGERLKVSRKYFFGQRVKEGEEEINFTPPPISVRQNQFLLPRAQRQDIFVAGYDHTHGVEEMLYSFNDIGHLVKNIYDPSLLLFTGLETPLNRYYVFRSANTYKRIIEDPQLSHVEEWVERCEATVVFVYREFIKAKKIEDQKTLDKALWSARASVLSTVIDQYDLQLFGGPRSSKVIQKLNRFNSIW